MCAEQTPVLWFVRGAIFNFDGFRFIGGTLQWSTSPRQYNTHTHTQRLTAFFPGLPGSAGTRKVKPIWILLKQEIMSGSGISWAICKSAPRSRQITTPVPYHSSFLQARCPSCGPTNSVKALKAKFNGTIKQTTDSGLVDRDLTELSTQFPLYHASEITTSHTSWHFSTKST